VRSAANRLARLTEAAREHGDVIALREGWMFCHPDAVRDVLVTNDKKMKKSPALKWVKFTLGNGLLTSEGDFHQRQRRLIQPSLHPGRLANYAEIMTRHSVDACESWKDGQTLGLHREMMHLTLRIVAEALFGAAVGPEVDAISDAMDLNVRMFQRVTAPWGPLLAALPTPFNIRYVLARRKLMNTLRRFIARRRASGEVRDDLLSRLLSAQDPEGGGGMSEKQLVDECVTLFAAGHETTANALTYTLWLLSQNPKAAEKLHAEVDRVLGSRNAPSIGDLESLTYTRMVVAESMRLYPPAWVMGRQALESCEVAGYAVPRGAVILISQWVTHKDPRWWSEPERFLPERFAPDAGNGRPRWAYFPFGGGSRQCVGEAFAWAEAMLVLATIVRAWRMEAVEPGPLELDPGITLRPAKEIRMVVKSRSRA
jgi:cytochrome P450